MSILELENEINNKSQEISYLHSTVTEQIEEIKKILRGEKI
tara:strand:+ start:673 stop:795 length:123 start_codon:yes stop_codon:yes gene_type:complete